MHPTSNFQLPMLSKTKIKWIKSLERKKNRDDEGLFIAEGTKIVSELLPLLKCRLLVSLQEEYKESFRNFTDEIEIVSHEEYKKATLQKSPQGILGVFEKPEYNIDLKEISNSLTLALDDVQDPGNLGTIIRLADWFGIKDAFCSPHCADVYNPKTIQATMGAVARVRIHYVDLVDFLKKTDKKVPVYGTFMDGKNIYREKLSSNGVVIMGNEGNGISKDLLPFINSKLTIPGFPMDASTSESLNVGIATAIVISEFRRKIDFTHLVHDKF